VRAFPLPLRAASACAALLAAAVLGADAAIAAPPPNDDFANAASLGSGSRTVTGTTRDATAQPGEPHHLSYPVGEPVSVWYSWRAGAEPLNVDVEACGTNDAIAGFAVYRGSGLGSLQRVALADPEYCQPPPSAGFRAQPGVTYWIAVTSDTSTFAQGPFTLRIKAAPVPFEDAGISQRASSGRVPRGGTVTYTTTLTNRGNTTIRAIWVELIASRPNRLARPALNVRYLSFTSTRGRCKRETFFVEHRGVMCAIGRLKPGQRAVVKAKLRLRQPITHWSFLDYAPGSGVPHFDKNRRNNESRSTTLLKG
jgi:hypothetical protein